MTAGLRPELEDPLLRVEGLTKVFAQRRRPPLTAVDRVSFDVAASETLGFVGESGCGKSTAARCLLRLIEPTAGRVTFAGVDLAACSADELRRLRRRMQIMFQDPYGSLDARMTAGAAVEEPLRIHGIGDEAERRERVEQALARVGIAPEHASRRPHAFSGGQRQRIALARALILRPELLVLDEPVTALDVSVQAQVLNLLVELQDELDLTYVFVVHDLAVAEYFCHRIAVFYLGAIVELAPRDALFAGALHPYTHALLAAVPVPDPTVRRRRTLIRGETAPLDAASRGCRFRDRCPVGRDRRTCAEEAPPLAEHAPGHWAACHYPGELQRAAATGAATNLSTEGAR